MGVCFLSSTGPVSNKEGTGWNASTIIIKYDLRLSEGDNDIRANFELLAKSMTSVFFKMLW